MRGCKMTKEKTIAELISEFEKNFIRILETKSSVDYYEGLRQIDGPIIRSKEQRKLEIRLKDERASLSILKNEIIQRLGVEAEVAKMGTGEFWDFLQIRQRSF